MYHSSKLSPVERERLREREREARAQMTYEAEQRAPQDVSNSGPLFGEIVRLNPKSNDRERQQIERKLGRYDEVKHLLDQDSTNLYGIDGQPPPSPAPNINLSSSLSNSSLNVHEFKKPNACSQPQPNRTSHHHHHHHSSSQRGGFVKPADGKPPYGGRGFYPGQPMKHSSSSSNEFRSSGIVPVKNPPMTNSTTSNISGSGSGNSNTNNHSISSSGSRTSSSHEYSSKLYQSVRNLPKLHCEPREPSLPGTAASQANVENILNEMTSAVRAPLTSIPATPRKETESKFIFNPVSGQMESLSPSEPVDKSIRVNLLKDILRPFTCAPLSTSVFKTVEVGNPLAPFSPPTNSSSTLTATSVSSKTKTSTSSIGSIPATTNSTTSPLKAASTNLPYLKSVSLSEESDDDDNDAIEEEDDDNNEDSEEENNSNKSRTSSEPSQKSESASSVKLENGNKSEMSQEEDRASSSSEDSDDSDSCSDSEDSSSDSPSPPSLPLPELPDQDSKKWNLKNFLPQPTHGNTTPAPQTPQACENGEKSKTDDSDSSGDTTQKSQIASSSSSESDGDSVKSCDKPRKSSKVDALSKLNASEDSSEEDDRNRRKYVRRSSTSSQSSDDSDQSTKIINNSSNTNNSNNTSNSSANANSNSGAAVVGVVRPHQRKPPSPQVFNRNRLSPQPANEERFGFVQQRSMQISTAPEPQCELPSHSDSDGVVANMGRNRLTETYQPQRTTASINAVKSVEKPSAQSAKGGKGRKPKSPALVSAEAPVKKKRGRKRKEILEISDSEDEERKVKVPERKRPGRPPLKRNDPDDVDWNAGPRRKVLDKFPKSNVWGGRERRRSSLRSIRTVESDSDEMIAAPVKPTARVMPAVKKKESARLNRDSSCESTRNDSDFNIMSSSGGKNNSVTKAEESPPKLDVEGIAVQDKKKSDTLRKLFSRQPQESGGKNGGKGNGGKGKFGVIVVESETERKILQRSAVSPASTMHRIDRIPDVPRIDIASPLQQTVNDHIPDIGRLNDRVPALTGVQMSGNSRSPIARRQDRLTEGDSSVPTTPSISIDPFPKLTYNENGKPSLMCKIDLSKIPYILAKKRSEEIRIKSELADTRQTMNMQSDSSTLDIVSVPKIEPLSNDDDDNNEDEDNGGNRKRSSNRHSSKKKTAKRKHHITKDETPPKIFKSTVHTPSVDPESDSMSDTDRRKKSSMMVCSSKQRLSMRPPDSMHNIINSCYPLSINNMPQRSLCGAHVSDEDPWRSDADSCSSCSSSSMTCRTDVYGSHSKRSKHLHKSRTLRKLRNEHSQRHSSLNDGAPSLMHVPGTNYERVMAEPSLSSYQMNISELVRPLVPHGIYYSYLEHKVSEEINSESDNISPNVYLTEAKRLKYAADNERDNKVAQGMQYLEAILSFVLTGYVLERKNQMDTAFSMYSETLKLIVYISKKFRTFCTSAVQSNIPNKIAILSLRCESILNLKLYTMRELEVRDVHSAVTEYFNKPVPGEACLVATQGIPSPHSPTPSPAGSVGSNSSGYSSGDRRTSGIPQCIAVPILMHQTLQKQHNFYSNLIASFNYWEEADKLIFSGGNKDFFIELDRFCGPLTLHSSLKDLVHYVRVGIQRLKAIISHHQPV